MYQCIKYVLYDAYTGSVGAETPLVSLVQKPLQKPLSHGNQRARRGIQSCLQNGTERAALFAVSPAAPWEAFLLLQRIEDRKMKGGKRRKSPRTMQHNSSDNNTKACSEKGASKNERARGKRKVVYFKSAPRTDRKCY